MDDYRDDLERVEKSLREAERERERLGARIEGLRAERDALKKLVETAESPGEGFEELTKAEAIVTLLKGADAPMTLGDIAEAMTAGGKLSTRNGVSVYIDGLLKAGRVVRVQRGQYRAT
jgi:chromosome segregation ATPase